MKAYDARVRPWRDKQLSTRAELADRPRDEPRISSILAEMIASRRLVLATFATLLLLSSGLPAADGVALRDVQTINRDWKFFLGETTGTASILDDSKWERVGLPHSFSIPYFRSKDFYIGYGWYRKSLDIPADWLSQKRMVFVEFDGVFQEAEIFLNGIRTGYHVGGYTGFSVDLTPGIRPGVNTLAVRVNNLWKPRVAPRAGEHVFSGGIYRNVRLVVTDRLHVGWCGTLVTTPKVSTESATVNVKTEVVNASSEPKSCTVRTEIADSDGRTVCRIETAMRVAAGATATFDQTSPPVVHPKLWHPDHPYLYSVHTTVLDNGRPVDTYDSSLGFRWFEWTADRGFFLNGEHYYFRGANVHQDHAGWGDAVTDAGALRDVRLVKEAGFNFIRGSHYPHSPAFSEACNKTGILFWSENCFWGTGGSKGNGYWDSSGYPVRAEDEAPFEENVKASLREMIRVHRNNPSIVVWSMCNEVFFTSPETLPKVRGFLKRLVAYSHELDPTRPAAIGGAQRGELYKLGDIAGLNGDGARLPQFIAPGIPSVVSEYGSTMADRPGDYAPGWGDLANVSGQDKSQPCPWRYPWRSGEAIWCAFDHGSIAGARFGGMGILDYFRLPKRQWYWYRNEYRNVPPPAWPRPGTPAGLKIEADKQTLRGTDGTDDAQIVVAVLDAEGRPLSNSAPVTLAIESGPGEFPTGPAITFEPNSDIDIREGKAAIEFRCYEAGETVLRATSPGLKPATLKIRTEGAPAFVAGQTPPVKPRAYVRYVRAADSTSAGIASEFGFGNPTRVSGEAPGHAGPQANDGDKASFWQSPDDQPEAWWQVDLERLVAVTRIRLLFPGDAERRYRIETSSDGLHWKNAVDRTKSPVTGRERPEDTEAGTIARYVRLTFTGIEPGRPAVLSEMSVSGSLATGVDPK